MTFRIEATILERISDAFVALDAHWRCTWANGKAGDLFGRRPQDLVGRDLWSLLPEPARPPLRDACEQVLRTLAPITLTEHHAIRDQWYESRVYPSPDGLSLFFTNVTERHRAERQGEALLSQITESLPQAIWLSRAGGEVLYVSAAFEEIWGRPAADIQRDPSLIVSDVHPADRERAAAAFAAIGQGEPSSVEYRIVRPDGSVRWLATRGVPIRDEQGTAVRVAGVTEDVTGRLTAEAERERLLAAERRARLELEEQAVELESALADLREAADSLAVSEARYRLLFEANPRPMWVFDQDTLRFLAVNDATLAQYGYTREEMLAMTIRDIRPPQDVARLDAKLEVPLHGFEGAELWRHRRRDGSLLWVEISAHTLDFAGRPAELILAYDVTATVEAQHRLLENEQRLTLALEGAKQGLYDWHIESGHCYLTPEFERLLGHQPGEIVPHIDSWQRQCHPDDFAAAAAELEAHLERGMPAFALEYRMRKRSGDWGWYQDRGMVVERTSDGRALRVVGVIQDITERKQAEQERERLLAAEQEAREQLQDQAMELETTLAALHEANDALSESEERYRHFFDDDLTADYIARVDGTIVLCNHAFARTFGFDGVAEAMPLDIRALFPDRAVYDALLRRLQRERRLELFEIALRRLDGRPVDVVANMIGMYGEDGQLAEVKGYLLDVTERNALSAQLAQAQKMEVVGRLAGGVAHDFNNLLTSIVGHAQILLDGLPADHPHRSSLEEIARAGERSAQLTRQLLAFSRKQVLQARDVDLNDTVAGMSNFIRRLIGEDIVVTTRLDPTLGPVHIDPGQLEQVIMNLVVNARDAMPTGGQLAIQTARARIHHDAGTVHADELAPGDYAVLTVRDTGCGMDAETMGHIFEPFFTTKDVGKGTGLGLASVFGIITQSGGSIAVESHPGGGTTFVIHLPLAARPQARRSEAPRAEDGRPPASGSILLVEDDSAVRALTRYVLASRGFTVIEAESGTQALSLVDAQTKPIELLLTDVVMPGMTGKELASELRRRHPGLRVLYMSGYTDDVISHHGVLDEGIAFIEKPFTPDGLVQRVTGILAARRE